MSRSTTSGACSRPDGEGIRPVMGDPDGVARELQEPGHPVGRVLVVVDDEDSQAAVR